MLTKINTASILGVEGKPVTVETDLHRGLPSLTVVGLADATIREACSRIRPAILNSGYTFPDGRVTVNLVPAGRPKEGSHFDLPIAVGIMTLGMGAMDLEDTAFLGEVSLDGTVNGITGALPLAMCLRKSGIKKLVLPMENAGEVSILKDIEILPACRLEDVVRHIMGIESIQAYEHAETEPASTGSDIDFSQVIGQETAKRAALIGAAGNHGMLMMGGPGCGKTMIARRIATILPRLTYEERLEITGIYSVAGLLEENGRMIRERPFRSPHHTASVAALIGGGSKPRPGEISLAHRGVLFLDEFGEFDSRVIDAMRQPVEEGQIRINRSAGEVVFPSSVMVVAAANPCKCGNLWDENKICTCTPRQIDSHMRKLSGPFSDRIDMHVKMRPVSGDELKQLKDPAASVTSAEMRKTVEAAAQIQRERYSGMRYENNGSLDEQGITLFCMPDEDGRKLMDEAYRKMGLTMRSYGRVLKVARTIADISGEERIQAEHIAEALIYRTADIISNEM